MEGVGARLGRSSTRYGPATVFSGPVRKWKKKWVHVSPSNASNNHSQTAATNGTNGSHLLLFKWTPIAQSNNNNGDKIDGREENIASATPEEPPRRKFKYVPVCNYPLYWRNFIWCIIIWLFQFIWAYSRVPAVVFSVNWSSFLELGTCVQEIS